MGGDAWPTKTLNWVRPIFSDSSPSLLERSRANFLAKCVCVIDLVCTVFSREMFVCSSVRLSLYGPGPIFSRNVRLVESRLVLNRKKVCLAKCSSVIDLVCTVFVRSSDLVFKFVRFWICASFSKVQ